GWGTVRNRSVDYGRGEERCFWRRDRLRDWERSVASASWTATGLSLEATPRFTIQCRSIGIRRPARSILIPLASTLSSTIAGNRPARATSRKLALATVASHSGTEPARRCR